MPVARLLLLALVLSACDAGADAPTDPTPISLTPEAQVVVGQSNAFGVGLFAEVAGQEDGNLMLSPLSASAALTMLLNGADGDTYAQIRDLVGYAPDQDLDAINESYRSLREQLLAADPSVQLALANAVFTNADAGPFKAPFLASMRGPFDALVQDLDFGAPASLDVINGWASDQTNDRIPKVLDEIDQSLVMLLMNALYFKGDWSTPFERSATAPGEFVRADGRAVQVPMMSGTASALTARGDGYQALELPYGRRNFSMVVLLPDEPLRDFAAQLRAGLWSDVTTRLDAADRWGEALVRLPRFSFSYEKLLNSQLQALGMVDAFTSAADLTRMSDAGLEVSFVKQNTFVEVNEEGTEAAAVTTVGVGVTSAPPEFIVNRPFVFAIRERTTNTLLFIGQVADPS